MPSNEDSRTIELINFCTKFHYDKVVNQCCLAQYLKQDMIPCISSLTAFEHILLSLFNFYRQYKSVDIDKNLEELTQDLISSFFCFFGSVAACNLLERKTDSNLVGHMLRNHYKLSNENLLESLSNLFVEDNGRFHSLSALISNDYSKQFPLSLMFYCSQFSLKFIQGEFMNKFDDNRWLDYTVQQYETSVTNIFAFMIEMRWTCISDSIGFLSNELTKDEMLKVLEEKKTGSLTFLDYTVYKEEDDNLDFSKIEEACKTIAASSTMCKFKLIGFELDEEDKANREQNYETPVKIVEDTNDNGFDQTQPINTRNQYYTNEPNARHPNPHAAHYQLLMDQQREMFNSNQITIDEFNERLNRIFRELNGTTYNNNNSNSDNDSNLGAAAIRNDIHSISDYISDSRNAGIRSDSDSDSLDSGNREDQYPDSNHARRYTQNVNTPPHIPSNLITSNLSTYSINHLVESIVSEDELSDKPEFETNMHNFLRRNIETRHTNQRDSRNDLLSYGFKLRLIITSAALSILITSVSVLVVADLMHNKNKKQLIN